MISKLSSCFLVFSAISAAQTLTLVSGDAQLVRANVGLGSEPIVFQLTNGGVPVPNATITFKNSNGSFDTGLEYTSIVTNTSGIASTVFVPGALPGNYETYVLNAVAPGSNTVTFHETGALFPPTVTTLTKAPLSPYVATAGQPGVAVSANVFSGGGIANVAVSLRPFVSGNAPAGTLLQSISCQVNGQNVPYVLTDVNGNASCVPVFQYGNAALKAQYNGNFSFEVVVGDNFFYTPFGYNIAAPPPSVSTGPIKQVIIAGAPVATTVTAINGVPPYKFTIVSGSGVLPSGIALSTTGQITGVATTPGLYPFVVEVTDAAAQTATSSALGFSLAVSGGSFALQPTALPQGFVGFPYSLPVTLTGGVPPYKIGATGLPPGITAVPTDTVGDALTISGTPTTAGIYQVSVAGFDAVNEPFQQTYPLSVATKLSLAIPVLPTAVIGSPYTTSIQPVGGAAPYTYTATGLPVGLALAATGVISGTPTGQAGLYPLSITVVDGIGETVTAAIQLAVSGGALTYANPIILPNAEVATSYTAQIQPPAGGVPPYSYVLTGTIPTGITLSAAGLLTGAFPAVGTQTLTFTVTDAISEPLTGSAQVTVGSGGPSIAAIVNAASSGSTGFVSPGALVTLYGTNFGPTSNTNFTLSSDGTVPTTLAGVQVMFGTTAAPVLFASATQINVIAPFELPAGATVPVTISFNGTASSASNVTVQATDPGIFLLGPTQGAVINADGTVNSATNPATAGSYVSIYATGAGAFTPVLTDGQIAASASTSNVAGTSVTIGGTDAPVLYAGAAPGLVAGVLQLNVTVPAATAAGSAVPVVLTIAGASTQSEPVTIAVAQ